MAYSKGWPTSLRWDTVASGMAHGYQRGGGEGKESEEKMSGRRQPVWCALRSDRFAASRHGTGRRHPLRQARQPPHRSCCDHAGFGVLARLAALAVRRRLRF